MSTTKERCHQNELNIFLLLPYVSFIYEGISSVITRKNSNQTTTVTFLTCTEKNLACDESLPFWGTAITKRSWREGLKPCHTIAPPRKENARQQVFKKIMLCKQLRVGKLWHMILNWNT